MIDKHSLVSTDRLDGDWFTSVQSLEHALNQAIVQAEISESYDAHEMCLIERSDDNG